MPGRRPFFVPANRYLVRADIEFDGPVGFPRLENDCQCQGAFGAIAPLVVPNLVWLSHSEFWVNGLIGKIGKLIRNFDVAQPFHTLDDHRIPFKAGLDERCPVGTGQIPIRVEGQVGNGMLFAQ